MSTNTNNIFGKRIQTVILVYNNLDTEGQLLRYREYDQNVIKEFLDISPLDLMNLKEMKFELEHNNETIVFLQWKKSLNKQDFSIEK